MSLPPVCWRHTSTYRANQRLLGILGGDWGLGADSEWVSTPRTKPVSLPDAVWLEYPDKGAAAHKPCFRGDLSGGCGCRFVDSMPYRRRDCGCLESVDET
jgi:hypothetical protein